MYSLILCTHNELCTAFWCALFTNLLSAIKSRDVQCGVLDNQSWWSSTYPHNRFGHPSWHSMLRAHFHGEGNIDVDVINNLWQNASLWKAIFKNIIWWACVFNPFANPGEFPWKFPKMIRNSNQQKPWGYCFKDYLS